MSFKFYYSFSIAVLLEKFASFLSNGFIQACADQSLLQQTITSGFLGITAAISSDML